MAKGGKVQHWKHGWIPLTPEAKAYAAGTGPKPVTSTLDRPRTRPKWRDPDAASADGVTSKQVGGFRVTTVDGFPDVNFKEVVELDRRKPSEYREVAAHVHDVLKDYPDVGPVEIGFSNELDSTVMADTSTRKPHKVRLNVQLWDDEGLTAQQAVSMRERNFGLTAQAKTVKGFRANVITHELGHLLNMRDQDNHTRRRDGEVSSEDGPTDELVYERVTPRELGYTRVKEADFPIGEDPPLGSTFGRLDTPQPRWKVDSLDRRSAYAISDPYEFFAEAFLDGTINGSAASESGKRAVGRAKLAFGGTP